jgi:hypothetical protein
MDLTRQPVLKHSLVGMDSGVVTATTFRLLCVSRARCDFILSIRTFCKSSGNISRASDSWASGVRVLVTEVTLGEVAEVLCAWRSLARPYISLSMWRKVKQNLPSRSCLRRASTFGRSTTSSVQPHRPKRFTAIYQYVSQGSTCRMQLPW